MAGPVDGALISTGLGPSFARCLALRTAVFVDEQGVPAELEEDGLDEACVHILVFDAAGADLGCARLRALPGGQVKAERVAVRADLRGQGVGRFVMDLLEAVGRQRGASEVLLSAQVSALPFYEKLGYAVISDEFMDAGIPHRKMSRRLA